MKKTLITLAALAMASVAQAGTTVLENTTNNTDSFSGVAGAFTMKIVLDWDAAISKLGNWENKSTLIAYTGSAHYSPLGITLFKGQNAGEGAICLGYLFASGNSTPSHVNPTQGSGAPIEGDNNGKNVTLTPEEYKNSAGELVLYVSYDPDSTPGNDPDSTSGMFSITTAENNGVNSTWSYISVNQTLINGDYKRLELTTPASVDLGTIGAEGSVIKSITYYDFAVAVPEPATATLSLLALAGLAARRRRK